MRVPSRQRRRLRSPKPPLGVSTAYREILRAFFASFHERIEKLFLEGWERNPVHFTGRVEPTRKDSWLALATDLDPYARTRRDALPRSAFIKKRLGQIDLELQEKFDPGTQLSREIKTLAARVNEKGAVEFRRLIGISLRGDLGIDAALDAFRDKNVSLIKSLQGQELDEISDILAEAEIGAWRVEELQDVIKKRFDVTTSKAELLARDQVLKLNGDLVRTRQTRAGITKYVWTTSGDERVRPMHDDLDGTIQDWNNPPVVSEDGRTEHPGGDYQCRCTPYPVLEELEAEGGSTDDLDDA